jgi:hypothetical protein
MSRKELTFYRYVTNYNTDNINKFLELFGNTVEKLPDKMISSKHIIKMLNNEYPLNSNTIYFRTFKNVFMDYFTLVLN